ncbi:hypothetical protein FB451DRAFT_1378181 [Mycena latifolia]|nr:hypothetical protein FB451DRAFT_1378181 [Mycena latifolia]
MSSDHQDVEMAGPDSPTSSQSEDRISLRQWLAESDRSRIIATWLQKATKPTPQSLLMYIKMSVDLSENNAKMPPWLELSISERSIPSTFGGLYEEYKTETNVVESLIWEIWHASHPRDSSAGSSSSTGFSSGAKAKFLHDAFTADYQGDAPARFCKVLETGYIPWYQPAKHYGRIIATVQSSATGKTRLYYKIGETHIPAFALCFREFDDESYIDPSEGWPYGDRALVRYFRPWTTHTSEEVAAAFLGQLYKALARSAHESGVNCFAHLVPSLDPTTRETFLQDVCSEAEKVLVCLPRGDEESLTWCRRLFEYYVEEFANQLGTKLQNRTKHPGADFLLIVDECAQLDKLGAREMTSGDTDSASFLTGLRRIVKAGDQKGASSGFWVILLDTHGETYTLYPVSRERASSARLVEGTHIALPPWIDLGLDVNLPADPPHTPRLALSLDWLKKTGRPYWAQLLPSTVLTEASAKLFCGDLDSGNLNHVIAAMSRRIHLPLSNDSSNTSTHLAAVEKHMRYMQSIGWEDGMVTTAALSEPVLSIAAANTLLASPITYSKVMRRFLDEVLINEHLVERGRLGETLASVVLTIARDAATCTFPNANNYGSKFVGGTTREPSVNAVTATQFIESLFQGPSPQFRSWGDGVWINFTHFDLLPHILGSDIPVKLLLDAWCRSVAFQCADNQPIYDLLIPIYLGDLDKPFAPVKLSYTVIQIKARVGAAGKGVLASLTGPMINIGSWTHKPPYLAILMDLGTLVAFQHMPSKKVQVQYTAALVPKKKTSASVLSYYASDEPSRWVFHARGLTEETYPSLSAFGAKLMHRVLYGMAGEEDEAEGREIVRSAATDWAEATSAILTKGC